MKLKLKLIETEHCTSRDHCRMCRDTGPAGRAWRVEWGKRLELPPPAEGRDAFDFECPFEVAWRPPAKAISGHTAARAILIPPPVPAEVVAKREAACRGCDDCGAIVPGVSVHCDRQARECSCGSGVVLLTVGRCRAGRW